MAQTVKIKELLDLARDHNRGFGPAFVLCVFEPMKFRNFVWQMMVCVGDLKDQKLYIEIDSSICAFCIY